MKCSGISRFEAGVLLLLVFSLFTGIRQAKLSFALFRTAERDRVGAFLSRVEGVREALPERVVLGYLSDRKPESVRRDPRSVREFYLCQYALAPALIVNDTTRDTLLANFPGAQSFRAFLDSSDYEVLLDLGDGVGLLRRPDR